MDTDIELQAKTGTTAATTGSEAHDEVDFTSGYEEQYAKEYKLVKKYYVPPPDKRFAWHRDWKAVAMVLMLAATFLLGTILLIQKVFSTNVPIIVTITGIYLCSAIFMIWLEVCTVHVR